MRCPQPAGLRGSLKWIQRAANDAARPLDRLVLDHLPGADTLTWLSPRADDAFAEYRDASFLKRLGLIHLTDALAEFWPPRGPQWDALATTDRGHVVLIEAKAHTGELCSPRTQAGNAARKRIAEALAALAATADFCRAAPLSPWTDTFYQLANRLAHLHFLRRNGVDAHLALVDFVGDVDMHGPLSADVWDSAYGVVEHVMGLRKRHPLSRFVFHVRSDIRGWPTTVTMNAGAA